MNKAISTMTAHDVLTLAPVLPVLVIEHLEDAVPLAQALVNGGLPALEITLRTPCALEAISEITRCVPDAIVGAGTVTSPDELSALVHAGAAFALSPGSTPQLLFAGQRSPITYIPAVSTVSELMLAMEAGYRTFKFFPAESVGGVGALRAIAGPFPDVRFCPTGGINAHNYLDYLALPNVTCVGGSWVAPANLIKNQDWQGIEALAKECVSKARLAVKAI